MDGTRRLYFDHNASAPLLPQARDAMLRALSDAGNPSSVHREGRRARGIVEDVRRSVASLAGADPDGVIFTSGASEAANAALSPLWRRGEETARVTRMAVVETDHPCFREGGRLGAESVTKLPVDVNGHLLIDALGDWLDMPGEGTPLLAITLANNESGVIQPLAPIREALAGRDVIFLVDAVQAAGRMPLDIADLGADAILLSGHKIGAAIGVGALVLADPFVCPAPLIVGGGQERRHRAGTEAVPAIASFGAAAGIAAARGPDDIARLLALRTRLEDRLKRSGAIVVGDGVERLPNTVFVAGPGLRSETAQIALDLQGFAVSGGSACASGKVAASPVLAAHHRAGLPIDLAAGAIRVSFGYETAEAEVDAVALALSELVERAADRTPDRRVA